LSRAFAAQDLAWRVRPLRNGQLEARAKVALYARFIDDAVDYVLNQLIKTTLLKDRDFLAWR
jgi:hypothetical protein